MQSGLNFTFPFQKINQEQRIVTGIATADNPDLVDDVVNFDASVEAFSNWVGNIREMHSPVAVGKLVDWKKVPVQHEGETYQGIEVSVYISKGAESTWQKILDGTLRGFSIGGYVKDSKKKLSEKLNRQINEITRYTLGELSVVDNPCNPAGMFAMIKSVNGQLEYVAESIQDVFYCEDDKYVSVGGESTCAVCSDEMIIIGRSEEYDEILINKFIETINDSFEKALSDINTVPTDAMAAEAKRGLEWRKEFNRGGTPVGVARARDIMNKDTLSISTVRRMHSFFSRHEVDKQGRGFTPGDGYPSAGRIAWALWGGDPGQTWARAITNRIKAMDKGIGTDAQGMTVDGPDEMISETLKAAVKSGDFVSWNSSGGAARGKITRVVRSGSIDVPNSSFSITGTEDDPALLIQIWRKGADGWAATDKYAGHKSSTVSRIADLNKREDEMNKAKDMCKYCDDTGYVMKDMSCPCCGGTGEISDGENCDYCGSQGSMSEGMDCAYCKMTGTAEIGSGGGGIKKPQQGIKPQDRMSKMMPEPTPTQEIVIQVLRRTVSEAAAMYFHAHGYHWNVRGGEFYMFHALFAEIYEDVYGSIDPLAEFIVKLGGSAPKSITEFSAMTSLNDTLIMSQDGEDMAKALAMDNDVVLGSLNMLFQIATTANEQAIANFAAERIDAHQKWAWQLKVTDDIYETPDTMEESMVSKNEKEGDLQMNKNYDNMSDMTQEDFTETQKQNILSKLGSFLFGKDASVEKGQVINVNNMNHNLRIVSEGNMANAPTVTIDVGGGMLEESVGATTPKMDIINATPASTIAGDSSLTGQGPGEFALEEVTIKSVDSQTDTELSVREGEEEMDFEKVLEGLGALLDEKLEKVKADITAEVDGKIDAIEKSVSEAKDAADELSGELEKVANSGAGKKSADIDADGIAEDEALTKSIESESFWGGMFVPTEVVKALGYDS
jgi:DNA-binding ferritin-like protein